MTNYILFVWLAAHWGRRYDLSSITTQDHNISDCDYFISN